MNDADHFGFVLVHGRSDFCWVEDFTERAFQLCYVRAGSYSDVGYASAKDSILARDHAVARFNQIDHAAFHPRAAGAANRHRHLVLCLKHLPQHRLQFVHYLQEIRIEVSYGRRGHGCQNAGMDIARPGPHQRSGRRINAGGS